VGSLGRSAALHKDLSQHTTKMLQESAIHQHTASNCYHSHILQYSLTPVLVCVFCVLPRPAVSQELSGLTVAASPDALVDEVSQSVLKAPTAAPSNFTSRAGSGSLHAEHSKASDDAKDHEEHANTDNHHSSELAQEHSSTKEHHEHTNVPNEHSSELAQEHSSTKEHHEHASIPNEHSSELHKEHSSTKEHSEHASIPNEHSSELHKEHSSTKEHTDHASIPNEHSSAKELDEHASMQKQHSAELPKEHSAEAQHDHPGGHEHGEPSAE
jgi:hypothetical protein